MLRRSLLHFALAAAVTLVGASCLSPTLPLPPPETESMTEGTDGFWTIAGTCDKGAIVTVFNETQGQGVVIEDRDRLGKFVVSLKANLCDQGFVSESLGTDASPETPFVVEPRSRNDQGAPSKCH